MESQTKTFVLHDVIRRFATGGKDITPAMWQDFVEAQNDGYRTGQPCKGLLLTLAKRECVQ